MVMVRSIKRMPGATYADIEALPPHLVGQLILGTLIASPRPAPAHARATSDLGSLLGPPFRFGQNGPGGWWLIDEPELHLRADEQPADVLVPDLAGWRRERLPTLPATAHFELAPDWVCEVLSPSTASIDRGPKLAIYARAKVSHAWLLDPEAHTLEVLRLTPQGWLLAAVRGEADRVRVEPFEALELDLALLWDLPSAEDQ